MDPTAIITKLIETSVAIAALCFLIYFLHEQIKKVSAEKEHYRLKNQECLDGKIAERDKLQKEKEDLQKQLEIMQNINRNK